MKNASSFSHIKCVGTLLGLFKGEEGYLRDRVVDYWPQLLQRILESPSNLNFEINLVSHIHFGYPYPCFTCLMIIPCLHVLLVARVSFKGYKSLPHVMLCCSKTIYTLRQYSLYNYSKLPSPLESLGGTQQPI
jgi:hypothetical protein